MEQFRTFSIVGKGDSALYQTNTYYNELWKDGDKRFLVLVLNEHPKKENDLVSVFTWIKETELKKFLIDFDFIEFNKERQASYFIKKSNPAKKKIVQYYWKPFDDSIFDEEEEQQ